MAQREDNLSITSRALNNFYDVVDDPRFSSNDSQLIYEALKSRIKRVPFCEYLKRYIYKKAGLSQPFDEVPLSVYKQIIADSFHDTGTPSSFEASTARISALASNWLTQQSVNRNVVFLLGFGLRMSVDDVNYFLMKALKQQKINLYNPHEIICLYCYKNGFDYIHYKNLASRLNNTAPEQSNSLSYEGIRNALQLVYDDESLLRLLAKVKNEADMTHPVPAAKQHFNSLYLTVRRLVADRRNKLEKRSGSNLLSAEDITESDIESVFCSSIPKNGKGNLIASKFSELYFQFEGRSFSRQHIHSVLEGKTEVSRFDIITMNFLIFTQKTQENAGAIKRFSLFKEQTNRLLEDCGFAPIYAVNPYESFILMCVLSHDPMETYADILEMSYAGAVEESCSGSRT